MGAQDTTNLVGIKTTSVGDGRASGILAAGTMLYNGSSNDHMCNNIATPALASSARTATTTSADNTNFNARGVRAVPNVTAVSGTGGLQLHQPN